MKRKPSFYILGVLFSWNKYLNYPICPDGAFLYCLISTIKSMFEKISEKNLEKGILCLTNDGGG